MMSDPAVALTLLLVLGFAAQWLAARMRVPAILPLLLMGIVLGPVTGAFDPDKVLGPYLFPLVSLAVAVILFEGSLTLRFSELRTVGSAVRGMVTYGALLTLGLLAVAAHWIVDVPWGVAFLFGALTCVTGPTVITPLLRTLRPTEKIASALRWEGIILDPAGALFAVLVFEAVSSHHQGHSLVVFGATVAVGAVIGLIAAGLLAYLLYQQLVPEFLQTYCALALVLGAFTLSNRLSGESGLLAVTIMGIALGNTSRIHLEHIMDFKEHLSTLLVSMLFLILAARLKWPLPDGMLLAGILVFLAAQVLIRPLSIAVSTWGSGLNWRERALLGYVAPRGVVAASVSSLVALRLQDLRVHGADTLVPLVFILIIATVVLQSATARPLAKWLKVAEPEPTGVLILGSDAVARAIGKALAEQGVRVLLADDDWDGISKARMDGLATFFGKATSHLAEMNLDLGGLGHLFALSTERDFNQLACLHYRREFGHDHVYHLHVLERDEATDRRTFARPLRTRALFGNDVTHARFDALLQADWSIKSNKMTEKFEWPQFQQQHGDVALLLFAIDPVGRLHVADADRKTEPRPGWTVVALAPPAAPDVGTMPPANPPAPIDTSAPLVAT